MIYLTSDLHFGHDKEFLYVPRGYTSIQEHDTDIIQRWNAMITDEDDVYILGDLVIGNIEDGIADLQKLHGRLHVIYGNHDSEYKQELYRSVPNIVEFCGYATLLKYDKFTFYLSHYPTLTDNFGDKKYLSQNVINLCGHTHTQERFSDMDKGFIYHCELDAHNNVPVAIEEVLNDLRTIVAEREGSAISET